MPIRVGSTIPMEPDHYIQSVEVSIDHDPVPAKGKFLFTPRTGAHGSAYQMRSGTGGWSGSSPSAAATASSGRPTRSASSRADAARHPSASARDRVGSPEIRLPRAVKAGEPFEVRARVSHGSHTGLLLRQGKFVRDLPEYYVKTMTVWLDDQRVSEFQMTSAVSPNPLDPVSPQGHPSGDPSCSVREQRGAALGRVAGDPRVNIPPTEAAMAQLSRRDFLRATAAGHRPRRGGGRRPRGMRRRP